MPCGIDAFTSSSACKNGVTSCARGGWLAALTALCWPAAWLALRPSSHCFIHRKPLLAQAARRRPSRNRGIKAPVWALQAYGHRTSISSAHHQWHLILRSLVRLSRENVLRQSMSALSFSNRAACGSTLGGASSRAISVEGGRRHLHGGVCRKPSGRRQPWHLRFGGGPKVYKPSRLMRGPIALAVHENTQVWPHLYSVA